MWINIIGHVDIIFHEIKRHRLYYIFYILNNVELVSSHKKSHSNKDLYEII